MRMRLLRARARLRREAQFAHDVAQARNNDPGKR
jgi:hypothetical protein